LYIYHLSRPYRAIQIAGDDITRLSYVTNALLDMQYNDLATQTLQKIKDLLEARCSTSQAPASAFESLAQIYTRQNNNLAAIECYRRALEIDYSQVYWRLNLARLLAESRQIPEAIRETKICLRLRPELKAAEELLEQLSIDPAGFSEEVKLP
jgi:tetratricopeptide (TPR) repeat protein